MRGHKVKCDICHKCDVADKQIGLVPNTIRKIGLCPGIGLPQLCKHCIKIIDVLENGYGDDDSIPVVRNLLLRHMDDDRLKRREKSERILFYISIITLVVSIIQIFM